MSEMEDWEAKRSGVEGEKERERPTNSRVCQRRRHRKESEKERKKSKEIERKKGEIFVCGICVSYVYVICILSEGETGEERDECRVRRETRSKRSVFV